MEWIDVKNQIPPEDKWIIGGNKHRVDFGISLNGDLKDSTDGDKILEMSLPQCNYMCLGITHWMPLPDPPGKKRKVIVDILEEYEFNGDKIKK